MSYETDEVASSTYESSRLPSSNAQRIANRQVALFCHLTAVLVKVSGRIKQERLQEREVAQLAQININVEKILQRTTSDYPKSKRVHIK